jgi:hypothetical protein
MKLIIDMWAGNRAGRPAATYEVVEVRLSGSRCCQPNGGAENNGGTDEKSCDHLRSPCWLLSGFYVVLVSGAYCGQ